MTEESNEVNLTPVRLAFIIDGEVVDIMYTDDRLGAILLSAPKVIDISNLDPEIFISVGYVYDEATGYLGPKKPQVEE